VLTTSREWIATAASTLRALNIHESGEASQSNVPPRPLARLDRWNPQGVPGIVLALGVSTYWMIPRALDAALASGSVELAKFVSLPLLVGLPLALSWPRLHPIAKGFVAANWIPMLGVVGWLYRAALIRLCNYYLTDEQQLTGDLLVVLTVVLAALWLTSLFWRPDLWARNHSHAS